MFMRATRGAMLVQAVLLVSLGAAAAPGLTPSNHDGFETGDHRNFLPKYRGDSEDWIRPRFSASSEEPIEGQYSLKWEGGEEEHRWVLVSNAFYLGQPFTASVQVRVDGPEGVDFSAGLMLLETYEKFAGIHTGPGEAGLHLGVHRAKSEDGIHFTDFEPVWHEPAVGIDDWREGGVDYGVFLGDGHGHVPDPKNRILYYQGRNNYGNNHPGWQYHGSERVLLAGWFTGLHLDVPTHVKPDGAYEYESFPFGAERIDGLYAQTTSPGCIVVTRWPPDEDVAVEGELRGWRGTSWRIEITGGLEPESSYDLIIDGEVGDSRNSGTSGDTVLRANLPSDGAQSFRIEHQD